VCFADRADALLAVLLFQVLECHRLVSLRIQTAKERVKSRSYESWVPGAQLRLQFGQL
jgi:hypothetical protein